MKMNLKAKDFADKASLEKSLSTLLKKPVMALKSKKVEKLPFCYEADYFEGGGGFMSIGVAKEIQKLFKTGRSKGKGVDKDGKATKVDKKKVAFGEVVINADGKFEFQVVGGIMKPTQAKGVIKSIAVLKKEIGVDFVITKAGKEDNKSKEEEEAAQPVASGSKSDTKNDNKDKTSTDKETQKAEIKANVDKAKGLVKSIYTAFSSSEK